MATNLSFFLASLQIAQRTGALSNLYMTRDGFYVVDSRLLKSANLTADEQARLQPVTRAEALTLIAQGGYQHGIDE